MNSRSIFFTLISLATAISISTTSVYADFIENSYIVTFKKPTEMEDPLIYPPDKTNQGQVPFGEHSSGQSKEQLAAQLELDGQVLSIYDTINAAHIQMTPDEAHRLSLDKRVLRVEQDRVVTPNSPAINPSFEESSIANKYPTYQDGTLIIPLVNTSEQSGAFQDVTLQLTEQGEWRLLDFKMSGTPPLENPHVETVELIITESFPVQVFLKVNGMFIDGCTTMGKVSQRLIENRFEITMFVENHVKQPENACTTEVIKFEKIIPLSVYGQSAGTYEYTLGDVISFGIDGPYINTFTGTFELAQDNILPPGTN